MAAREIADRAWGRPKEFNPATEKHEEDHFDPCAYTPEELDFIKQALRRMANPPKRKVKVLSPSENKDDAP
jgi:hypothetical protein